jgi:leucine dehydrogenase
VQRSKNVTGISLSSSVAHMLRPKTSYGIFKGIESAVQFKLGRNDVAGLTVAVQGVGQVGYYLCKYLHEAGANLVVADIDAGRVRKVVDEFSATSISLEDILVQKVDVVAPCALGAIMNAESIPMLQTSFTRLTTSSMAAELSMLRASTTVIQLKTRFGSKCLPSDRG